MEAAGAVRVRPAAWTPHGGWLRFPDDSPRGFGLSRRRLDPLLRELAASTPGVELIPGQAVVDLRHEGERVAGAEIAPPNGKPRTIRARLTVAADGRDSGLARLARVPARVRAHGGFFYFAYWRGLRPKTDAARIWFLDPEGAGALPCEDDMTVVVAVAKKERLSEFRADTERAYLDHVRAIPGGPDLSSGERVSKLIGKLDVPNKIRPAARAGIAFVGDAAVAADPSQGVGCGWAFQSAEWLVEETAEAVLGGGDVDRALGRYRRAMAWRLGPHHWQISDQSTGRRLRANERLLLRMAAARPEVGAALEQVATRRASIFRAADPRLLRFALAAAPD
jgi:2-polyprenyl-6-methoxyphenol hydroxylase-like FAD-dependent oxidoreductase